MGLTLLKSPVDVTLVHDIADDELNEPVGPVAPVQAVEPTV